MLVLGGKFRTGRCSTRNGNYSFVFIFKFVIFFKLQLTQIQLWPNPSFEMVAYRSFEPFMPLLLNDRHSSISLWALWGIHHVNTKKRNSI